MQTMADHSEMIKDDVIIVKMEEEDFPRNAESNNNVEKENTELKTIIEKMKYEKEKLEVEKERFENKYEMEKLKSENASLKAAMNEKILSDNKRRIEEELESMTNKKAKLDEEQTKSQAEIAILKENSQKLQENYEKLEKEKSNLEKLYRECKREKENALRQKKAAERMLKLVNSQRSRENKQAAKKTVVSLKPSSSLRKADEIDYSRMPLNELVSAGVSMILTEKGICPNYSSWYSNIMSRSGVSLYISQNCKLVQKMGSENIPNYINGGVFLPNGWKFSQIRVKILHAKDNTKSMDVEQLSRTEWFINELSEDYFSGLSFLMLIMKI